MLIKQKVFDLDLEVRPTLEVDALRELAIGLKDSPEFELMATQFALLSAFPILGPALPATIVDEFDGTAAFAGVEERLLGGTKADPADGLFFAHLS
ncbi:hypothetical protein L596_028749 [Steinernema carpocapsae]|uniref:Uncharacterized protein n=1 Tax=Steinernema carpocapsae TaxID=34508 RepID=A0A4V6XVN7_STECR|nr:hypothetical protein L596_028749 [Steinernema carpocapsae]